jgi:hypothetical protein
MYASFTDHWPGADWTTKHVWHSATDDESLSCGIGIQKEDVPHPLPATLYIGVRSLEAAGITITVYVPRASAPIELVPGQAHRGSVKSDQNAWFTFTPEASSTGNFTFTVAPLSDGCIDLYVSPLKIFQDEDWRSCGHPSSGGPTCAASDSWNVWGGVRQVTITPGRQFYCRREEVGEPCVYKVRDEGIGGREEGEAGDLEWGVSRGSSFYWGRVVLARATRPSGWGVLGGVLRVCGVLAYLA